MGRPASSYPTITELKILNYLWSHGIMTVRDIADEVAKSDQKIAYTSIATIVRIMVDKGYVEITDARRPQKFKAVVDRKATTASVIDGLIRAMFGGSRERFLISLVDSLAGGNYIALDQEFRRLFKLPAGKK